MGHTFLESSRLLDSFHFNILGLLHTDASATNIDSEFGTTTKIRTSVTLDINASISIDVNADITFVSSANICIDSTNIIHSSG